VECGMHGWEYNVVSGECLTVPDQPLQKYPVKVENDDILIGIDFDNAASETS
jgi:nitrite reductase/ring-hydroxylating ferredoxin subunit